MEKEIKKIIVSDKRMLEYIICDYYPYMHIINEYFHDNEKLIKRYGLARWDDYGFQAWTPDRDEKQEVLFEFDIEHPLYIPLLHLINYDEELLIDDDLIEEINKRYLAIYKKEDKVYLQFIDKSSIEYDLDKFHVFIKNIGFDLRSKIDCEDKDTKERLYYFFKEINNYFSEDYHQITLEEYYLNKYPNDINELKKYVKRKEL